MKICHIITALEIGGAETMLANFCNIQSKQHQITVIYLKSDPKICNSFNSDIELVHIPLNWLSFIKVNSFLNKLNPDILHTHLAQADFIGQIASFGTKAKRFCTMHNIHFKYDVRDTVLFKLYWLYFKTLGRKTQVICISKAVQVHVQKCLGVSTENTHLVYNGVSSANEGKNKDESRRKIGLPENAFVVLFIGRLEKQKSVHTLLESIPTIKKVIPNLCVEIVGEGSLLSSLIQQKEELLLQDEVQFRGTTDNTALYYNAADVFVLPSIFEGLGNVVLEAFSASLPVVASNLEGPKELITHRENGILFEKENYIELAQAIIELYTNIDFRNKIGHQAGVSFKEKYNIEFYSNTILGLYS